MCFSELRIPSPFYHFLVFTWLDVFAETGFSCEDEEEFELEKEGRYSKKERYKF